MSNLYEPTTLWKLEWLPHSRTYDWVSGHSFGHVDNEGKVMFLRNGGGYSSSEECPACLFPTKEECLNAEAPTIAKLQRELQRERGILRHRLSSSPEIVREIRAVVPSLLTHLEAAERQVEEYVRLRKEHDLASADNIASDAFLEIPE